MKEEGGSSALKWRSLVMMTLLTVNDGVVEIGRKSQYQYDYEKLTPETLLLTTMVHYGSIIENWVN